MTPGRKESLHVAGGKNAGIVVNKEIEKDDDQSPSHLSLQFRVFLRNATTKRYTQEKRVISYWFKVAFSPMQQASAAQDFFKQLVSPTDFPRDYVGFIKKIMKLMQHEYPMIAKIEVEMTQEMEMDCLPIRASDLRRDSKMGAKSDGTDSGESSRAESAEPPLSTEDILGAVEEAYPNSLTIDDMSRRFKYDKELIRTMVLELVSRNLVKPVGGAGMPAGMPGTVDTATGAFRRVHHQTEDGGENVTVVKGPMRNFGSQGDTLQPTIAIITVHYFEKMAVDAMMINKQTFVRYATNGEANVYTLGDLGCHRVVTTKLPMTTSAGDARDAALIATGSTTTRLLGTFQGVEHVFIVGVGGAVPHYTDFDRHVRLGDVVISDCTPPSAGDTLGEGLIYQHAEKASVIPGGAIKFETKSWCPPEMGLQEIARKLVAKHKNNSMEAPWLRYFDASLKNLKSEGGGDTSDWKRPPTETDRLYMSVGGGDVIEVGHPTPRQGREDPRSLGQPMIHVGPVAAGRLVATDPQFRQEFSSRYRVSAFNQADLAAVVESIYGNRKDQYMLILGMTDYRDGTKEKVWQQYSVLMAAAVLKAIVEEMPPPK